MQTRTYADLFALIQALCGVVFASIETGRIKALINRRAQRAYRSSNYWTRFLKIGEERAVGPGGSPPVQASVEIGSDNSKLKFTANPVLFIGADGNNCRVRAINPGTNNASLNASQSGYDLTISLATNSSGFAISTALQIKTFILDSFFPPILCNLGNGSNGSGVYEAHDYVSLEGGVNEVPPLDITANVVPYSEAGLQTIDTFLRIFKQAPYIASSVQEFDFTVTADGATLVAGDLNPSTAFLTYKAQFTDTYGPGLPDGLSTDVTSVPAEWFQYLAHGTYADYLRAEGQQEKAALADQEAEALLTEELIRLDENHTSGFVSNRIRTNANMQLRW
jgi:hypothetical protein